MSERKLATIQEIADIKIHPNADRLELAQVMGWQIVVAKGEFKKGDHIVFCEVDSFLPIRPEFEFLRPSCYRKMHDGKEGFRLKTIRLRKELSQGLVLPLTVLPAAGGVAIEDSIYSIGDDVTELLGITKYEAYVPAQLKGVMEGRFPSHTPKTDVERIQSSMKVIDELQGKEVYITQKMDGTSTTYYCHEGKFGICSRNWELKEDDGSAYAEMAKTLNLKQKLVDYCTNKGKSYSIQSEMIGSGIQRNKMGLEGKKLLTFDVYDIKEGKYLGYDEMQRVIKDLGLESVPLVYRGPFTMKTFEELMTLSESQMYQNKTPAEGIVIRPVEETYSDTLRGRTSVKVISNKFLLKYEE